MKDALAPSGNFGNFHPELGQEEQGPLARREDGGPQKTQRNGVVRDLSRGRRPTKVESESTENGFIIRVKTASCRSRGNEPPEGLPDPMSWPSSSRSSRAI